jgi:hypothetical protein
LRDEIKEEEMGEVPIREGPIRTMNDLMDQTHLVFMDLRKGKISESTARVLFKGSDVMTNIAKLGIQYMRLMRPRSGSQRGQVPILPGSAEDTSLPSKGGRKKTPKTTT